MSDLYSLINFSGVPVSEKIEKAIDKTYEEIGVLTSDRTCMVYCGFLLENLKKEHAISRLVDTNDLGCRFQHQFILVNNGDGHYLVDLTFEQFKDDSFSDLLDRGYMDISDKDFHRYLESVTGEACLKSVRDAFDGEVKIR